MAVRTSSNSGGRAAGALLLALLGVAVVPAAVAVSRVSKSVHLLDAGWGVPVAGVLGVVAVVLATRARRQAEWMLGRASAARLARTARALGILAVCIAVAGAIALGYYEVLRNLK